MLAVTPSFTLAGSEEFDRWLADRLAELARDVRSALGDGLLALVLGGGYGRGEGAVVGERGDERPYNDLDLVVVVRAKQGVMRRLAGIARRHEHALGIAVDFSRPLTPHDIERWEHRLRWYDLLHGHLVLAGDEGLLIRHAPALVGEAVPPGEAARLLLNRGAGLVGARRVQRGLEPPPDADFVRRVAYKALLAVGDAYLILHRALVAGHAGRLAQLRALAGRLPGDVRREVLARYDEGVAFKIAPDALPADDAGLHAAAETLLGRALLDVETRRHGIRFASLAEYARWTGPREPQPWTRRLWNLAANLRHGVVGTGSPREPLYRELPALLEPGAGGAAWERRSAAFLSLWQRVND